MRDHGCAERRGVPERGKRDRSSQGICVRSSGGAIAPVARRERGRERADVSSEAEAPKRKHDASLGNGDASVRWGTTERGRGKRQELLKSQTRTALKADAGRVAITDRAENGRDRTQCHKDWVRPEAAKGP